MTDFKILLRGFNKLFCQWLEEKLNGEKNILAMTWDMHELRNNHTRSKDKAICIQLLRNKSEIEEVDFLMRSQPDTSIICWWNHDSIQEEDLISLLNHGASAVITDKHDWNEIMEAIQQVGMGGIHYNEVLTAALFHYCKRNRILRAHLQSPVDSLGEREKRIIALRREGKTSKEIGEHLFLSKKTIDKLFGDLYRRFECNNFFELMNACALKAEKEVS